MKGKILILFIGIVIGAIITTSGFLIYNKSRISTNDEQGMMKGQMQDGGEMPDGEKPDDNPPEMPNDDNNSMKPEESSNIQDNSSNA